MADAGDNSEGDSTHSWLSKTTRYGKIVALEGIVGLLIMSQPVLGATKFCATEMGSFVEAITSTMGVLALAGIIAAVLLGVAARPFIRNSGQASALNGIISKAFVGLIILVLAIPVIAWGLEFTSFSPATQCIPFI